MREMVVQKLLQNSCTNIISEGAFEMTMRSFIRHINTIECLTIECHKSIEIKFIISNFGSMKTKDFLRDQN